jgi:hypothetical protein
MIRRLEPEALKEFIRDYMDGQVFTSASIRGGEEQWARDVGMVFMPVLFGCLHPTIEVPEPPDEPTDDMTVEEWEQMRADHPQALKRAKKAEEIAFKALTADLGVIWAYMKDALPRGVNGYPMFMSARLMHKDDWTEVMRVAEATRGALETAMEGGP